MMLSCSKDEEGPELAAPGTIVMELDGVRMESSSREKPQALYNASSGRVLIVGFFEQPLVPADTSDFAIRIDNATTGIFDLKGGLEYSSDYVLYSRSPDFYTYYSFQVNALIAGKVVITKMDVDKKLISGTFVTKVSHENGVDVLTINNGSFTDIPWQ